MSSAPAAGNSALAVELFNDLTAPEAEPLPPDPLFDGLVEPNPAPAPAPMRQAAPRPGPPVPTAAPGSSGDPLLDFLGPPPAAPPPSLMSSPRRQAPAPATVGCRECNKPLTDPFDQAIGTCEDCRSKQQQIPQAQISTVVTPVRASSPPPASVGSIDLPPLEAIDMSGVASDAPALALEPRSGVRSNPPRPALPPAQPLQMRATGSGSGGMLKGLLVALVVLAVGGGAGYYFLVLKPEAELPEVVELPPSTAPIPPAIQAVMPRWELKYLDLTGSSMERLEEGAKHLAKDQRSAYLEAEDFFQQALLLEPRSDAAIAGYVQAAALGRGTGIDKATFDEALALIEASEERAGRTPLMLLAHANLLLCRPDPTTIEQARVIAEEVLNEASSNDREKAEAHLILGRVYLRTSMPLANQHFDDALRLSPDLQRVEYHRALANEAAGAYTLALNAIKGRLEKDPEHWDSLVTMARIYLEVGEVEQARKLYEARLKAQPNDARVLLALAVLRYQVDGNAGAAARDLRALLKNRQRYSEREVAEMLVHLAAAERMAGNVDAGVKAAEEAAGLVKDLPAAHLQLFLAAMVRGDAAKAATHLKGIQGNIEDTALEKVLEGRLRLAEKKPTEALELFHEAVKMDSRREDALLLAGIAAAQAGRRDDAFRIFFQALQADPFRLNPRPVTTLYFLRPGETLAGLNGSILALSTSRDDVAAPLYEGLLLYHVGDKAGAERQFRVVLELDQTNAGAAAYMSLVALQRGDGNKARTFATRAVAAGRQMPVAHLANGLALAQGKQLEPAKRSLRDALTLAPGMLAAEVKLAELELASNREGARSRLLKVTGLDPMYLAAKRLLFMTDQRG